MVVGWVGCGGEECEARDRLSIIGNAAAVSLLLLLLLLVLVLMDRVRRTRGASSPSAKQALRSVAASEEERVWAWRDVRRASLCKERRNVDIRREARRSA